MAVEAVGACIESHTDVRGGVFVLWRPFTLAVGVVERLGYTVLARELGREGKSVAVATAVVEPASDSGREAAILVREPLACCIWAARRASSAAT